MMAHSENADTVKSDTLNEVVVNAELQRTSTNVTTYIPTAKIKKSSQDASDLLLQMAIPQLAVNPISKAVTTPTGQNVAIFINYLRVSSNEMQGLKTTDVLRVEYHDYPIDPRFQGVPHAVNIIVHEYEYGGYTKISDNQFALSGFVNKGLVYSKFAYRKMVYDLYAGWDFANTNISGTSEYSIFRLPLGEINRNQEWLSSELKNTKVPLSIRASYVTKNIQIVNTVGFSINNQFEDSQQGQLSFEPSNNVAYKYENESPQINRAISWSGNYFISLPKLWSIVFYPRLTYAHNNSVSKYSTDIPNVSPIVNDAKEDVYNLRASAQVIKRINQINTAKLVLLGGSNIYNVSYLGTSPYDTYFTNTYYGASVAYALNIPKFSVDADAGVSGELFNVNTVRYDDLYPFAHLSASWSPNKRNRLNLWFQYATSSPNQSQRSPNIIQSNELLFQTGNPLLQNSRHVTINSTYTFMPQNKFMMQGFVSYYGIYNRAVALFDIYDEGRYIIRTFRNSGDFTRMQVGVNATLKLLDNKLTFQIRPALNNYSSTGDIDEECTKFSCSLYGQYYWNDFRISAYYATRNHAMNQMTGGYNTNRSNYQMQVGWANGSWNIGLSVNNFLRYRYDDGWGILNTPLYSKKIISYSSNAHAYMMFSATYTFGYGKKIKRGNEIEAIESVGTAIME